MAWLGGEAATPGAPVTLAELFAQRKDRAFVGTRPDVEPGWYL